MDAAEAVVAEAERAVRVAGDAIAMARFVELHAGGALGFLVGAIGAMERKGIDTTELRVSLAGMLSDALAAIAPAGN